jgi:hypothetical protein
MLDKRSSIYSDRPIVMMAGRLVGWEDSAVLLPFSDPWKKTRRTFSQFMGTRSKVDAFSDVLQGETHSYLRRILADPEGFVGHGRQYVFSVRLLVIHRTQGCVSDLQVILY